MLFGTESVVNLVSPSVGGPNEVNKLETRLHPQGQNLADIPFKAFARSPNARLGGCMSLDLSILGPIDPNFRFESVSLVLEQRCTMKSHRRKW